MDHPPYISVVGPSEAGEQEQQDAETVGRALAHGGAIVVTGGRGGVMAAASRGAAEAGGVTLGILPGTDRREANEFVKIAVPTGLGELRNGLVVRAADALVAVGGATAIVFAYRDRADRSSYGTLSEVALALRAGVPVIGLHTWKIDGIEQVQSAADAAARALERARR